MVKKSYENFLRKVAHFQVDRPYLSLFIILVFTLMIWGGISQVKTVASLEQMMPKDIEEIRAFNVLRDNGMGQDMIAVVLQVDRDSADSGSILDITDKRVYDYSKELKSILKSQTDVIEVFTFSDIVDFYGSQPVTDSNYLKIINEEDVKSHLANYVNADYTTTVIIVTTDISADDSRMILLSNGIKEQIEGLGNPRGVDIKITGTPVIQQKLGELISHDRKNTQWISTLFVFLIVMLIFRSITSAIVPIIVVYLSVNWLYGTMGYVNLPISTLAGGVAAMVIGIGIDFAIHIMNKFKYERKAGHTIKTSVELAVMHTGIALTATSLTTIGAFLAFIIGVMPEMGRFGILMAIGIFYSLVFSLFGLPALLIIEERVIYYFKSKFNFGIEGELKLCEVEKR